MKEGEKLADILSMPVKDALGRDVEVNYESDIANVLELLDATMARKNIFSDSVELHKLTLAQVAHVRAYERDAAQAVQWLDDLFQVSRYPSLCCLHGCYVRWDVATVLLGTHRDSTRHEIPHHFHNSLLLPQS